MIVYDFQDLLKREHDMRFGDTAEDRGKAFEDVVRIAFHHPLENIRQHARDHVLRTRGISLFEGELPIEGEAA